MPGHDRGFAQAGTGTDNVSDGRVATFFVRLDQSRARVANHPGHSSQKSHGRKGGGRAEGRDLFGTDVTHAFDEMQRTSDQRLDGGMAEIQRRQGFDGKPVVVSREEFDRAVADGEVTETFRGIHDGPDQTAAAYAEQYRTGDLYVSSTAYGAGTCVAHKRSGATDFAGDDGEIVRIGLRSDARVVTIEALRSEMKDYMRQNSDKTRRIDELDREMTDAVLRVDDDTAARMATYADYKGRKAAAAGPEYMLVGTDPGRFAAMRGYDAIDARNDDVPQMVILNRTAVIVEAAS
jgi:hypothetical protein